MTERDLTTLLRDELAQEPPLEHTSADAIRTARRQSARRGLLAGGAAALAVAAVVALGTSLPRGGEEAAPATGTDDAPPVTEVMEAAAQHAFTPYVDDLGAPEWSVNTVLGEPSEAGAADAQHYLLSYRPANGPEQLNLTVGGFAPEDMETYGFADSCRFQKEQGRVVSCSIETLEDGSLVMTSVALRTGIDTDAPRMLTRKEARAIPDGYVWWVRVVSLSTPDGMAVDAAEYVPADDLAAAVWTVPLEVLTDLALDPVLRAAEVAHEPMPMFTDE